MDNSVKITLSAQDKTAAAFKTATANIAAMRTTAASTVASLGSLGKVSSLISIAGLTSMVKSSIDALDSLNDLADATGASVENISALEDVALRTGVSFDTVGAALTKFNGLLNAAKPGSQQAEAFAALGLSVEKLKAQDPAEALRQTAVALDQFADNGNKGRVMEELFGKSTRQVAAYMKDLAKETKLVSTVTKEQTEEAEKFNKALATMQTNLQGVSRDLSYNLVRSINAAAEAYRNSGLMGALGAYFTGDAEHKQNVRLVEQTDKLLTLENEIGALKRSGTALDAAQLRYKQEQLKTVKAEIDAILASRNAAGKATAAQPNKPSLPDLKGGGGGGGAVRESEFSKYLANLQKQLEKTQELTNLQQLGVDINSGRIGKLNTTQQLELIGLAQKLDAVVNETEAQKALTEAIKKASAAQEEFFANVSAKDDAKQARIGGLLGATPTEQFKAQQADLALLQTEFEQGRIDEQLYAEAVTARFELNIDKIRETTSLADELGLSFTSAFEEAIVGGKNLSEVLAGIEQDILRIVTRKLVTEPMGNAISGMIGGGGVIGGDFGNFLADLVGINFAGGGYTGSGARSGGMDGQGGFMAVLHPQETVVDHTKGQRLAGGNSVTVNISQQFAPGTTRATTLQAAADASRQLQYAGRNL